MFNGHAFSRRFIRETLGNDSVSSWVEEENICRSNLIVCRLACGIGNLLLFIVDFVPISFSIAQKKKKRIKDVKITRELQTDD